MAHGTLVIATIGPRGYTTELRAGAHTLRADEPLSVGGADLGVSPYELLLAAVASCKAITMRMYVDRKGWDLAGATLTLSYEKIHAEDCAECETKTGKVDRIECVIELRGELSEEQRRRIIEIADKCPVHQTLTSETVIKTRVAE